MSKKSVKNEGGPAGARPAQDGAPAGIGVGAGNTVAALHGRSLSPRAEEKLDDALFELYVARVATIDRFRVPITDRGLPATYRKAFEEAVAALEVFMDELAKRVDAEAAR